MLLSAFLLFLCFCDAFFTDIGIRFFGIEEANPIMAIIYDTSTLVFYTVKLALPLLLFILLPYVFQKKKIQMMVMVAVSLYTVIFLYHLFWLSIVV